MGEVHFYHLTRSDLVATLRVLLGKCAGAGWRVALRTADAPALEALDLALWQGAPDSFLAHGVAGGGQDAQQPVLLSLDAPPAANAAEALMSVGGAQISAEEVGAMARSLVLFDGGDPEALSRARAQWKALTEAGCGARYWSEAEGPWAEKASKNIS